MRNFLTRQIMLAVMSTAIATIGWIGRSNAHHGFQGRYDSSSLIYLQGTVRETRWQAPHSILVVQLPRSISIPNSVRQARELNRLGQNAAQRLTVSQNLLGTTQQVEFPPVGSMTQPLRDRLKPGEQIRLLVYRNCERPNQLRVQFAQLQSGVTVVRPGTVQTEVNGCGR
jgi:hypothetical protein